MVLRFVRLGNPDLGMFESARVSRHSPSSLCSAFQTLPVTAALGADGLDMKPADNVVILERCGNQEAPNLSIRAVALVESQRKGVSRLCALLD